MATPNPKTRLIGGLLLSLSLALGACTDPAEADLPAARFQLSLGHLERAEALLNDDPSPEARAVEQQIRRWQRRREALEGTLTTFRAGRAERPGPELREELAALLRPHREDPECVRLIEQEMSDTADWVGVRDQGDLHTKVFLPRLGMEHPIDEEDPLGAGDEPLLDEDDPLLADLLAQVDAAIVDREWRKGATLLDLAVDDAPQAAAGLDERKRQLLVLAEQDLNELLARARETERSAGQAAAHEELRLEVFRYPSLGFAAIARLDERIRELNGSPGTLDADPVAEVRVPRPVEVAPRDPAPVSDPGDAPALDPSQAALALEQEGRLGEAALSWEEAAGLGGPGASRWSARAASARARFAWRQAVAAAFTADPADFASKGVRAVDPILGPTFEGDVSATAWAALEVSKLRSLHRVLSGASDEARLGFVLERLAGEDPEALADLGSEQKAGRIADDVLFELIARDRGEVRPAGGYVFREGAWLDPEELDRARVLEEARALAKRIKTLDGDKRDDGYAELEVLAAGQPAAAEVRAEMLREIYAGAMQRVARGTTFSKLEDLAELRRSLDQRRAHALELIFDEEKYYYPWRPPAGPADRLQEYLAVQREIDGRVEALRAIYEDGTVIQLTDAYRSLLGDLHWSLGHLQAHGLTPPADASGPTWLLHLDLEAGHASLDNFAWDAAERRALRRDAQVRTLNRRRWQAAQDAKEPIPQADRQQVVITNDYRVMLGRPALAWDIRIHEAAAMHSGYMANTGNFGHTEEGDPARRSPFDRMRTTGYENGVSENVHMGGGGAPGAHHGWTHSSGHHRNLLSASHTEMASANVGRYWTQKFGRGSDHLKDLD